MGRLKIVFTLSSSVYCAVHWLVTHDFSIYVLSGALVFGVVAATAVAWISFWLTLYPAYLENSACRSQFGTPADL